MLRANEVNRHHPFGVGLAEGGFQEPRPAVAGAQPMQAVHQQPQQQAWMQPWPQSWSGTAADISTGKNLVRLFLPFVEYLQNQNFTCKTIRRHVDNLWCIGGEIIRDINLDSALAQQPAASLLHSAIADGAAPLVRDASQSEQDAIDATARKLAKFLAATT